MSNPGSVPERWLECPRKSNTLIMKKFLAFKTPLDDRYKDQLSASQLFTLPMLFTSMKSYGVKLGLWVDLTNTSRFYSKEDVESFGCNYIKLQCRGHGETPSKEQTEVFIKICRNFISQNPLDVIGVHCTHGFNRTGFMIVSYMVEQLDMSLEVALREFSISRPPGIYKPDYIEELYTRYDDIADMIPCPERPDWCFEFDDSRDDDATPSSESEGGRRRREFRKKNPVFMEGVSRVSVVIQPDLAMIQRRAQDMCLFKRSGFPGSQPVSMDMDNLKLLASSPYRVSWKADGTRYMMLIDKQSRVFFLDRDNSVFQVEGIKFYRRQDKRQYLTETLLDGEMVIDKDRGKPMPRYLIYDIIRIENENVMSLPFYPDRFRIIQERVIEPRIKAMKEGHINRDQEPFGIRRKEFWDIDMSYYLLGEKFISQLSHEPDGLIFQPSEEPYICGPCNCLKWKPGRLNSVDFKLKVEWEEGQGVLRKKKCQLYVGGQNTPFASMKYTKALKDLDNKIVECKFENGQWVFMRERTDKSFPNSYNTAVAVCKSITEPVTQEVLLRYIQQIRRQDSERMPPPPKRPRK